MALYYYVKQTLSEKPVRPPVRPFVSLTIVSLGAFILGVISASFGIYYLNASRFQQPLISAQAQVLGESKPESTELINPELWFTQTPALSPQLTTVTHYNLSIPALKINRAIVEIGGEDLGKSMIHYSGSSLPGQPGNAIVFCHSVLPQFFNPKNYKTICSTLPTLELGDEILVYFDGIEYLYQIVEMFEVQPEEVSVLKQGQEGEYLSLITCVPPGTYLRRLVVKARLI